VYIYGSYRIIKTGLSLFWTILYALSHLIQNTQVGQNHHSAIVGLQVQSIAVTRTEK